MIVDWKAEGSREFVAGVQVKVRNMPDHEVMTPMRALLAGFASFFLAEYVFAYFKYFRFLSGQKAIGVGVLKAIVLESLLSPLFWAVAILSVGIFLIAGRLANGALRTAFFWIPAILINTLGFGFLTLLAIAILVLRFKSVE